MGKSFLNLLNIEKWRQRTKNFEVLLTLRYRCNLSPRTVFKLSKYLLECDEPSFSVIIMDFRDFSSRKTFYSPFPLFMDKRDRFGFFFLLIYCLARC